MTQLQLGIPVLLVVLLFGSITFARTGRADDTEENEYSIHHHNYEEQQSESTSPDLHAQESGKVEFKIHPDPNSNIEPGKRGSHKHGHTAILKPINRRKKHILLKVQPRHKKPIHNSQPAQQNTQPDEVKVFHTYEETHEHIIEKDEEQLAGPQADTQTPEATEQLEIQAEQQFSDPITQETQHFHSEEEKHEKHKKIKVKHHHHHHHHNHIKEIIKKIPEPYPVEKIVHVPVEKLVEKVVHVPKPYPVEKIIKVPVEKLVHVPKPYAVEKIVEKKVPYPVEKIVEKIVHVPVEKIVEKIIHIPKPYPVERIVEKIVHVPVEKIVEKKVPYPVEKVVHVPVEKVVEKIVHVPKPYAVEKIVNKLVAVPKPYAVVKPVPYPVEVKVPIHVEKPVPYEVEKYVPAPYRVEVEKKVPVYIHSKEPYKFERSQHSDHTKNNDDDFIDHEHKGLEQHSQEIESYSQHSHDLSVFPSNHKPRLSKLQSEETQETQQQTRQAQAIRGELIRQQQHQQQQQAQFQQQQQAQFQQQQQAQYHQQQQSQYQQQQQTQFQQQHQQIQGQLRSQEPATQESQNIEVSIPPKTNPKFHINVEETAETANQSPASDMQTQASTNSLQMVTRIQQIALPFHFLQYHHVPFQQPLGFSLTPNKK
ncbi:titin isoform X2 [Musca domestica]|uniref:Titin isoform X2 n=1 Tax=Musca domestica TaxID=7370 RepID=A0ABM3VEG8_MUSDO|nr:titin isoform X2 [Musca domestica]